MRYAKVKHIIVYLVLILKIISSLPSPDMDLSRCSRHRKKHQHRVYKKTKKASSIFIHDQARGFNTSDMSKLRWTDGVIPYYIDSVSFPDKTLRSLIVNFLDDVNSKTRLRFTQLSAPANGDSRWIMFLNRRGLQDCQTHSMKDFTTTGVQAVLLGYDCMVTGGDLAEAVLSIAGVPPQHNTPNRDNYITINEENIIPDKYHLFQKIGSSEWMFHELGYDFNSGGHYHSHRYSSNGRATIQAKPINISLHENTKLSCHDIIKLNMLYNHIENNPAAHCDTIYEKNPRHKENVKPSKEECPESVYKPHSFIKNSAVSTEEVDTVNSHPNTLLLNEELTSDRDDDANYHHGYGKNGILLMEKKKKPINKGNIVNEMTLDLTHVLDYSDMY